MTTGHMAQVSGGWKIFDRGEGCGLLAGVAIGAVLFGGPIGFAIVGVAVGCYMDGLPD